MLPLLRKLLAAFLLISLPLTAQKVEFGGYVSGLYMPMIDLNEGTTAHNGLLHNRLNFRYNPSSHWSFTAEVRNRLMYPTPTPTDDYGWVDLSFDWTRNDRWAFNTSIERLNVAYKTENLSITLGRQRINWSQTLTFNPNDLFNGYSLFDFDYAERGGSDALRVGYFPSEVSAVEFACKSDRYNRITAAAMGRFNLSGWDVQGVAGVVTADQLTLGGGFSGEVRGVNLRGELSCFRHLRRNETTVVVSLGSDYVFSNSLMLSGEILYNKLHDNVGYSITGLYQAPLSPDRLSISEWTISAQLSYPFSPIINGSLSALSFVDSKICYISPSFDFSLSDNLTLSTLIQYFTSVDKQSSMQVVAGYLRLKYSF